MNQDVDVIKKQGERYPVVGGVEFPWWDEEGILHTEQQTIHWERRILPEEFMRDKRNNTIFTSVLLGIIILILALVILKVRIFGRTLIEYVKPIWFYVLGTILVVLSQYLIVLPYADKFPYLANISQILWALMVVLSLIKLCKENNFNLGNTLFLGIIYCVVIHGLKVTIRYLFYERTLFYVVDRFAYGSLLVMLIVIVSGPLLVFSRNKGIHY